MGICHHYVYVILKMFIDHFQIMMKNSEMMFLPAIIILECKTNKQKSIHSKANNI